jgi:branched-chain amino acid aminotransferase
VAAVLAAGEGRIGRLRLTMTSGPGPLGSARGDAGPTLSVIGAPASAWPAVAQVATVPWVRNERSAVAGLKTVSYADNVVALAAAHRRGADEALLANTRDELCEGTGTNVFVVVDGELVTPPLSSGCLAGITRSLVLGTSDVRERPLPFDVLTRVEEAFLTSSTRGVHPVATIDGRVLPDAPGRLTLAAAAAYEAHARAIHAGED